ncbi:uncharacterized protein LTR77_002489 [Saxophila tyrrhenica]|uniref:Rhodopsin domain-containing protein n=1 Tax=Saxophila tyrrhenica TaxID=1690608 RepID=A0AAV9PJS1_9PEZI|nr:hypothetical protein LTR77_002489 [Saxophila tyrrhenica]
MATIDSHGFETVSPDDKRGWLWFYFISRLFAVFALCSAKVSLLIFTRRIFSGNFHHEKRCFAFAYTLTAIYGIVAVTASSAGCRPRRSLRYGDGAMCPGAVERWSIITTLDVITELMLICVPMYFVSKNHIKRSKKMIVVFVFSFRLLVATFSIISTVTYLKYIHHQGDATAIAPTVAWQEVLLGFSLVSASIPCLRSFLWAFMSTGLMTNYGTKAGLSGVLREEGSPLSSPTANPTAPTRNTTPNEAEAANGLPHPLRPDRTKYNVSVQTRSRLEDRATTSSKSANTPSAGSAQSGPLVIQHTREVNVKRS